MKMRKVISLFTALVLSVSAFSTIALAGPTGSIKCKTNLTSMTPAEAGVLNSKFGQLSDDQYDIYLLTVSITGKEFNREDGFSGVSGDLLTGFEVNYVTEDNSNIYAVASIFNAMSKTYAGYNKNTKTISYQLTNTAGDSFIDDMTTVAATDETVMGKALIVLNQGTSVTFNVTSAASAATFDDGSVATGTDGALPVSLDSTTLTVGTTKPAGPVIGNTTVNESPKTDNYADYTNEDGKACYTQGFKATVAVSGNTGAAYNAYDAVITAKKGDATETKTVPGLTFVSGTTVQNGNVVVKLNVQYVPDGVTLTLDSITPVVK